MSDSASLSKQHSKVLSRLSKSISIRVAQPLILITLILALVPFMYALLSSSPQTANFEDAKTSLLRLGSKNAISFVDSSTAQMNWLHDRGFGLEARGFEKIATRLNISFAASATEQGIWGGLAAYFHFAALNGSFFILAGWRIWILLAIAGMLWRLFSLKPYSALDLLGQTGNGRLFFSGIRVGLDSFNSKAEPQLHVVGLACPKFVDKGLAAKDPLAQILNKNSAVNDCNLSLIAIIKAHEEYPAFVAAAGFEQQLNAYFKGANLRDMAQAVLEVCFNLKRYFAQTGKLIPQSPSQSGLPVEVSKNQISSADYIVLLQQALNRVLTNDQKKIIAQLDPKLLASTILAIFAGKVLTFEKDSGHWYRKSNFPELNSRAIIHSVPAFAVEYSYQSRTTIRRALIYSARRSLLGPIRLPIDMSDQVRALRQWTEVLSLLPNELLQRADEVELYGLSTNIYKKWEQQLFDLLDSRNPKLSELYATEDKLLFIPVPILVEQLKSVSDAETLNRLSNLVRNLSLNPKPLNEGVVYDEQRIFAELTQAEIEPLIKTHSLDLQCIKDWASLRVVLNSHSWLARRVGSFSVPEHSIIFAVFTVGEEFKERNSLGLLGKAGLVPLRSTRLRDRYGVQWHQRFRLVQRAEIVDSEENFQRLLAGKELILKDLPLEFKDLI